MFNKLTTLKQENFNTIQKKVLVYYGLSLLYPLNIILDINLVGMANSAYFHLITIFTPYRNKLQHDINIAIMEGLFKNKCSYVL